MRIGAIFFIDLLPTISISRDPLQLHHPFYVSQTTSSDCSVASITMAISFMLGLPAGAEEPIVTQSLLLKKIVDARWAKDVANGGSGVSFAEFVSVVSEASPPSTFKIMSWRSSDPLTIR